MTHSDRAGSAFAESRARARSCLALWLDATIARRESQPTEDDHRLARAVALLNLCAKYLAHGSFANATVRDCSCPADGALTQDRRIQCAYRAPRPGRHPGSSLRQRPDSHRIPMSRSQHSLRKSGAPTRRPPSRSALSGGGPSLSTRDRRYAMRCHCSAAAHGSPR